MVNLEDLNQERIFEYAAVLRKIPDNTETILDVGCCESNFSIVLSSLGFKVTGIDQRNYSHKHPNFNFIKCNIMNLPFEDKSFDLSTAVSTLEHIGQGFYGDPVNDKGVSLSISELKRVSKHQIYTLPTPLKKITLPEVLKTPNEWDELCNSESIEYFKSKSGFWFPSLEEEAQIIVLLS